MLINWGDPDDRYYEHGLDRGVLYMAGKDPIPWNGLISIDEGGEGSNTMYYRDGIIFLADADAGDYEAKLTTMFFPREFGECLGYPEVTDGLFVDNQKPKRFGFSYRSLIGSGSRGDRFGYQIHLVYNCLAAIGTRNRKTIGSDAAPVEFSFDLACTPVKLPGYRPTAHYVIDTRNMSPGILLELENLLYGSGVTPGHMPTPEELFDIMNFGDAIVVRVHPVSVLAGVYPVDIQTYTVEASQQNVYEIAPQKFQVDNANAVNNGDGTWTVSDGGTTDVIIE